MNRLFLFILLLGCESPSSDGFPKSSQLYDFEFQDSGNTMLITWEKSTEIKDDFYSYKLFGSNDSLMENNVLIHETFNQSDTTFEMNINEPFKYFRLDVVNRLTGYRPLYFTSSSNIIYFNINEWISLWNEYYSIFTSRLDLANSNINSLPENIVYLQNLERLDLSNNNLAGPIPDLIFKLKNLKVLILTNTNINGVIPTGLDSLKNLETLYLDQNSLSGMIPDFFCFMGINFGNPYRFNIDENEICPPYPSCIESHMGYQELSNCE